MSVSIDIEIKCTACNLELDADVARGVVYVETCTRCLAKERQEGIKEGIKEGKEEF